MSHRGTTCGRSYTKSSHLSAMQETGEPFLRSPLLARVLPSENSTAFVSNVCMKPFKAVQLMSARASPSAGRPSGILADNPEGSDGASEEGPTLMQGIPSKGSASSPAACWRRRVHARARTRARTPSRPRDVSAAGGSAGRRYGRLTKKEQKRTKSSLWAGFKSLESRPSRKGSCVSQCRSPDAPEMRQCQTKSFLGNLVRFKTCNHDFRNSLKKEYPRSLTARKVQGTHQRAGLTDAEISAKRRG